MEPYTGTRAGAVSAASGDTRSLEAALVDDPTGAETDEAASMLISTVERAFSAVPSGRDDLAAAALRHFFEELGLTLSLERADLVASGAPRVEVLGSLRQPGQVRRVVVAAMEGAPRHAVLIFSLPSGRYDELKPAIRASLDSFRREGASSGPVLSQTALGVTAALLIALILLALRKKKVS